MAFQGLFQIPPLILLWLCCLRETAALSAFSSENSLQGTHLARLLTVGQVRSCDTARARCLSSDCSFVLACSEACGGDLDIRVQCLTECNQASSSKEGQAALQEYKACAAQASKNAAVVRVRSKQYPQLPKKYAEGAATETSGTANVEHIRSILSRHKDNETLAAPASGQALASAPGFLPAVPAPGVEGEGGELSAESLQAAGIRDATTPADNGAIARFQTQTTLRGRVDAESASGIKSMVHGPSYVKWEKMQNAGPAGPPQPPTKKELEKKKKAEALERLKMDKMFDIGVERSAPAPTFADIEACVGCQYVWEKVRKEVGETDNVDSIMQAFEMSCQDMPDVFYESCDDMVDQKMWLAELYAKGATTSKMCNQSGICGAKGSLTLNQQFEKSTNPGMMQKMLTS